MSAFHDYESYGTLDFNRAECPLLEAFSGTSIVEWYGRIERQLYDLLTDAEKGRNWPYADKIREFLRIWRDNEIDGSINRETLDILKSASDVLAVDSWNLNNYFASLRTSLRKLIASEEELPRDLDMNANDPMKGGGGGRGAPPMSPDFGPQDDAPGETEEEPPMPGLDAGAPEDQEGGGDENGGGLDASPPAPGDQALPDDSDIPRN